MSKGVFLTEYANLVTDCEKDEFSRIAEWKDRIKYFWNHQIFDHILMNSFDSGKNDEFADQLMEYANQLLEEGKFQGALDFYNTCVLFSTQNSQHFVKALENRSVCLYKMNNFTMAIQDCRMALGLMKEKSYVLYERIAKCQIEQEEVGQANDTIEELNKCLDNNKIAKGKKQKIVSTLKNLLNTAILNQMKGGGKVEAQELHAQIPEEKKHPKFEAGLDCFDIIYTKEKGRYAVATRDIRVGETILVENPVCAAILEPYVPTHCHTCWLVVIAPVPCASCSLAVYCSPHCIQQDTHHVWECGNKTLLKLEQARLAFRMATKFGLNHILTMETKLQEQQPKWAATKQNKLNNETSSSTNNETNSSSSNEINSSSSSSNEINSSSSSASNEIVYVSNDLENAFHLHRTLENSLDFQLEKLLEVIFLLKCLGKNHYFVGQDPDHILMVGELLLNMMDVFPVNAHGVGKMIFKDGEGGDYKFCLKEDNGLTSTEVKPFGVALYTTLSLFNHSCSPSFVRSNIGNKVFCVTTKNIKCGEELFENYGLSCMYHDKETRQAALMDKYGFQCDCSPCKENWPILEKMEGKEEKELHKERLLMLKLHKAIVQKIWRKEGNKDIYSRQPVKIAKKANAYQIFQNWPT